MPQKRQAPVTLTTLERRGGSKGRDHYEMLHTNHDRHQSNYYRGLSHKRGLAGFTPVAIYLTPTLHLTQFIKCS